MDLLAETLESTWEKVWAEFRELRPNAFRIFFSDATRKLEPDGVTVFFRDAFTCERALEDYYKEMRELLVRISGTIQIKLSFAASIETPKSINVPKELKVAGPMVVGSPKVPKVAEAQTNEDDLGGGYHLKPDPHCTFSSFVVGECNRVAYQTVMDLAEGRQDRYNNPVLITGPVASGKTHLLWAIYNFLVEKKYIDPRKIRYVPVQVFVRHFMRICDKQATPVQKYGFNEGYCRLEVLLMDDMHDLVGRWAGSQRELKSLFDYLKSKGAVVIFTSRDSLGELRGLEEQLYTRLEQILRVAILPSDFELRVKILLKKSEEAGLVISPELAEIIVSRVSADNRALEGAVSTLLAAVRGGSKIGTSLVDSLFSDVSRSASTLNVNKIVEVVAKHFAVDSKAIFSSSRIKTFIIPRRVAWHFSQKLLSLGASDLGRRFHRDHSSIMHGLEKLGIVLSVSEELRSKLRQIEEELLRR